MARTSFTAVDISWVTDGRVTPKILSHWTERREWVIARQRLGRAHAFSRLQVIEAAIVSDLMSVGISREGASVLIHARAIFQDDHASQERAVPKPGKLAEWSAAELVPNLPEFEPGASDWYWVGQLRLSKGKIDELATYLEAVHGLEALAGALTRHPTAIVLNVSSIVRRVDDLAV